MLYFHITFQDIEYVLSLTQMIL